MTMGSAGPLYLADYQMSSRFSGAINIGVPSCTDG